MSKVHKYRCHLDWSGSTGNGYESFERGHGVTCRPATTALRLSSDPAFLGDPELLNPEQLLLVAASSCQMLSFLAVAARARITVTSYVEDAEAIMPGGERPVRITQIWLRPIITTAGNPDEQHVQRCVEQAHRECFIANSLTARITVAASVQRGC